MYGTPSGNNSGLYIRFGLRIETGAERTSIVDIFDIIQEVRDTDIHLKVDDCPPHSLRKDTKPSAKLYMSMRSTAVPDRSAISSSGQTCFFAMAVKEYFAFDKGCKWPKMRHVIDADIRPHFILCL